MKQDMLNSLLRGTVEVLPNGGLQKKLSKDRPLKIKVGFDPTGPDLHFGHIVLLEKCRQFQELGHEITFLIGDFTAAIGDPTGRDITRPALSQDEIDKNADEIEKQVFKILDREKTIIRRNSEWFSKMNSTDMIKLASKQTVARMLERDDFSKRFNSQTPIAIHEFFYTLAQGHDSVVLSADVEMGGTDQKFNLLMGRELQKECGQEEQCIIMLPILKGIDGVRKMSKSFNNHIGINESAEQIFGKVMSISDDLMWEFFELLTNKELNEINDMQNSIEKGENPVVFKRQLAKELTAKFCGEKEAEIAFEKFTKVFSRGETPDDIAVFNLKEHSNESNTLPIFKILTIVGLAPTSSQARRLINQKGVKINNEVVLDVFTTLPSDSETIIKVGKRNFMRVIT